MADVGFTSIAIDEKDGGLGLGLSSLVIVTEALGRVLAPEPLIPSLHAAQALALGGSDALKDEVLAPVLAGSRVIALAQSERGARYDLAAVALRAEPSKDGYVLAGDKVHVWGGFGADGYVVSARTSGRPRELKGITLFYVPAGATGVTVTAESRVDSQNAATVRFANVEVKRAAMIGAEGEGLSILERATERATVALCGEMLGGMSEAFERTVAYLKERKQFGVLIGTFQALKHRAARMYVEIELARSAVMAAARALDEQTEDASALVSLAKARLSDAYCLVANEAVQLHGGIGMTDEHEIGFFMKRARAAEMTFGDAAFHRDRFAKLSGY
jgi:acyl-CoA dehydrogenase